MLRHSALIAVLLTATGCLDPLGPGELGALRRAEARWESKNINDYTFEMRISCFCGAEIYEWAVVEVRSDQVVSATLLDGTPLTGYGLDARMTVEELFDVVRRERDDWIADIDATYDPELGYPIEIDLEPKKNIADAGATYHARNLKPL